MSIATHSRARRSVVAALVAVAVPLTVSTTAQAAPTAAARLAATAKKTPNRNVTAIVQFKRTVTERQALALVKAHKGKVTDKLPAVRGLAVKLPAKQASVLRSAKGVRNVTLNSKVHTTGVTAAQLATYFPKTTGADLAWAQGFTGKGVGVVQDRRPEGRGRGHRDPRAARHAARDRVRPRPGLLLRRADGCRRGLAVSPGRGRSRLITASAGPAPSRSAALGCARA